MSPTTPILFLHGLGDTPQAWEEVVRNLNSVDAVMPNLFGASEKAAENTSWTLEETTDRIAQQYEQYERPVHVVGLSLGAIVGLHLAAKYPDRVDSLFLSAPQAKLPKFLMSVQNLLMRVLPAKAVCPPHLNKSDMRGVVASLRNLDLTSELGSLTMPITLACGSKDYANLKAARSIAAAIPHAQLDVVQGVGHAWHTSHPELFATHLRRHLEML